jgi:hypothetical protein
MWVMLKKVLENLWDTVWKQFGLLAEGHQSPPGGLDE